MKRYGVFTANRDQLRIIVKRAETVWHSAFRPPVRYMRDRVVLEPTHAFDEIDQIIWPSPSR